MSFFDAAKNFFLLRWALSCRIFVFFTRRIEELGQLTRIMSELLQQSTSKPASLLLSSATTGDEKKLTATTYESKSINSTGDPDFQQRPKLKGWMEDVVKRKLMEQLRHVHKNAGFSSASCGDNRRPPHIFKFGKTTISSRDLQSYRGHDYWPVECKHLLLCTDSEAVELEVKKQSERREFNCRGKQRVGEDSVRASAKFAAAMANSR